MSAIRLMVENFAAFSLEQMDYASHFSPALPSAIPLKTFLERDFFLFSILLFIGKWGREGEVLLFYDFHITLVKKLSQLSDEQFVGSVFRSPPCEEDLLSSQAEVRLLHCYP
jgi:hypothetical protein